MASLNKLAENIAYSFNKQFDFTFIEIVKYNIQIYREKLLREEQFNNGLNYEDFSQNIVLELEEKEDVLGCSYLVTKEKIPLVIRFKSMGKSRFNFIGDENNNPFTLVDEFSYKYIKYLNNNTNTIYVSFFKNKLKVLNNLKLCKIKINGVFADPLIAFNFCENLNEIEEDLEYPISDDLFSIIKQGILRGDFPLVLKEEKGIIKTDSTDDN